MNEKKDFDCEKKEDRENISYPKKSYTYFNAKIKKMINKQSKNNKIMKNNKNLVIINKNQKQKDVGKKIKNIDKKIKKIDDSNNKLLEKSIKNSLIAILNQRNLRLLKNQREMLNILERLIIKMKNNNTDNKNKNDPSYKIILNNFQKRMKSITEKKNCVKFYNSFNCRTKNDDNNNSKSNENKSLNSLLYTPNFHEKTYFQNYQKNSSIKRNILTSKKYNNSNEFVSKSSKNYPIGVYNNTANYNFHNEKSFTSKKKNIGNIKFIFPEKKSCETRKLTRSIIKTEKTIILNSNQEIKPKETSEIKEKPITDIVVNPDGSKTTIIKNTTIKTTTENKIVNVPEFNIIQNSPKLILVKQFKTKEYQTITIYKNDIEKRINQTYINGNNEIFSDEINILNRNGNDATATLDIKDKNNIFNTYCEIKKKLFTENDKVEKIKKTGVNKLLKSCNEQRNNSNNKYLKNMKKDLLKSKTIKANLQKNFLTFLPKKQNNNKINIIKPTKSIKSLKVDSEIQKNIAQKLNTEFSKHKINFDMPEEIIDIKGLRREDSLSKERKTKVNKNNIYYLKTAQKTKSPMSNFLNEKKTENCDEEIITKESANSNKKGKIKKLAEFIYKLNYSSNDLNQENDEIEETGKHNKNYDIYNEHLRNRCVTEEDKMDSSLQIIDENYNNMQANDQKLLQQKREIKIPDKTDFCKNGMEKVDNTENNNLIKNEKIDNFKGGNNNYVLPKIYEDDDSSVFLFEDNYRINENQTFNNNFNKRNVNNNNKRINIKKQDIQLIDEKFTNIDNNEINGRILLSNNISSSEVADSAFSNDEICLEMSEFEKKK